jgi:hypothetical protein
MKPLDVQRLAALGLLVPGWAPAQTPVALAALCSAGALLGSLSAALDVRPDELVGPLCQRLGGAALQLRILEVRTSPAELWVRLAKKEEHWPVPDVRALVRALNQGYRSVAPVPAIAVLGAWDEAWQFWCIPKGLLPTLHTEGLLQAENAEELSALAR